MIELRCPACSRANAAATGADMRTLRCATCASHLEEDRRIRYRVAGEVDRGRGRELEHRDLALRVHAGTLGRGTLISEERGPWIRAGERTDLFAGAPLGPPPKLAPRARGRAAREAVPGSVETMANLGKLLGVLLFIVSALALFLAAFNAGLALMASLLFGVLGAGQFAVANGLRARSTVARNVQLGVAVLAGFIYLAVVFGGAPGEVVLGGGLFVAIPFLLLLSAEARAWFAKDGRP